MRRHDLVGQLGGIEDRHAIFQVSHLAQLDVGECTLDRPATAKNMDVLDRRCLDGLAGVGREIGDRHLFFGLGEDARDVDGDVAEADDRGGFDVQVGIQVEELRMAVVPADEGVGAEDVLLVLARYAEPVVVGRAVGEDDGVVYRLKLRDARFAPDFDVAEEPDAVRLQYLGEGATDALGGLVIGRDAEADQAERRRQLVDHVDPAARQLVDQALGDIHPARSRSDDSHASCHAVVPSPYRLGPNTTDDT